MNASPERRRQSRFLAALLSIPLRFKITVPYLVVAILLAGLATWLISQSFASTLQERFRGQLVDNYATASDTVFQTETGHLAAERAIAHTAGVAEAIAARNTAALDGLVRPIAVNAHLSLVHILDASGQPLYSLVASGDDYLTDRTADFAAWEPVRRVLSGESDELGDKFAGVTEAEWGAAIYTVGPVKDGERLLGAVLIGQPLAGLVPAMTGSSLANVTIYRPHGQAVATTVGGTLPVPDVSAAALSTLASEGTRRLQNRLIRLGSREYSEALGPLVLRGQPSGWLIGVSLPRTLVTENKELSPAELAAWFTVGVLGVIGLGVVVAQIIAIPIFDLVRASSHVAEGNLRVEVGVRSGDEIGLLSGRFNRMVGELRQREFMHEVFGRVVSEEVREALLSGEVGLGGELMTVTVLFTDIRGFTALSENFSPQEVVTFLNSYFAVITGVIRETGGFINKFGGDSMLAVYGAPVVAPPAESAQRALQAALAIRARLAEFNAHRIDNGQQPIDIGIAVNTGEVVTGNIGSEERFEYTVIGDTVNIAARVQGLTQQFTETNILITDATFSALEEPDRFQVIDHGEVALKGKAHPVRIFGLTSTSPQIAPAEDWLSRESVPRRDVLEALYLYCRGFSLATIALTTQFSPAAVRRWLERSAQHYEAATWELHTDFGLTDAELQRLRDFFPAASNEAVAPIGPAADTGRE